MSDVAKAIRFLQEQTGCRVVLESIVTSKPVNNAILKPSEIVSEPVKVADAAPAKTAKRALKSVSETVQQPAEQPAKRVKKATKPIKEKAATFMTVPKFAELKGCSTVTVYHAVQKGLIPDAMVNRSSGNILIDSRTEWAPDLARRSAMPIKVFCKETKMTFDSIAQAVKGTGVARETIMKSLDKGITTHKGLTFTRV